MPFVLYCVTEAKAIIKMPLIGIAGSAVESVEDPRLRCFVSQSSGAGFLVGPAMRESALAFHRVVRDIFQQTAAISFRFPTVLESKPEVAAHLRQHEAEYLEAFGRLRHRVQMEIRISYSGEEGRGRQRSVASSGADYLRAKRARQTELESAALRLREAAASFLRGWRLQGGVDQIRCFALLDEGSVANFKAELSKLDLASDLEARISGPWPPSEFLKEE